MRARVSSFLLSALAACAVQVSAQQHPNIERGLLPEKSYEVSDVDAVSLFNGGVTISIPLGMRYRVNGNMSYQFTASYGTNGWETGTDEEEELIDEPPYKLIHIRSWTYPAERMNAGFGWLVSFGDVMRTKDRVRWLYRSPDGGQHVFYDRLHANNPNEPVYTSKDGNTFPLWVGYTRDGTYLRLKQFNTRFEVQFPNGDVHAFNTDGKLTRMSDAFGNGVTVEYFTQGSGDPFPGSSYWKVSDDTGREHFVYFRPAVAYPEVNGGPSVPQEMVHLIRLAAFDSQTAEYLFEYASDGTPGPPSVVMARRCPHTESSLEESFRTSILSKIHLPEDDLHYAMTHSHGNPPVCSGYEAKSGNILSLRLPSGATIAYDYTSLEFPTIAWQETPGLAKRTVYKGLPGADEPVHRITEYEPERYAPEWPEQGQRRTVREKEGNGKVLGETRHYFATCTSNACGTRSEYGLPFSREGMPAAGPYLSTEVITRDQDGQPVVERSTYVVYEADGNLAASGADVTDINRRLKSSKTVFEDGTFSAAAHSNFDGLGHYRETVFTNDNPAGGNSRTTLTSYNPARGEFKVNPDGSYSGTFVMPVPADSWLLETYDKQQVTEGNQTSTLAACFDSKGFLYGTRAYADFGPSPSNQSVDVLSVLTRNSAGDLVREQFLGGDPYDGVVGAPTSSTCVTSATAENYRIDHKYASGVRSASYFVNEAGAPVAPFILDSVIDRNTGLTARRRDGSTPGTNGTSLDDGLHTEFEYDLLGRLTREAPPATATANRGASREAVFAANLASVDLREENAAGTSLLRKRTLTLDSLGHVTKETRTLPSGATAWRTWEYDGAGRITSLSAWGNQSVPVLTWFEYDSLGRMRRQLAPDQSITKFDHPKPHQTRTTVSVHTGGAVPAEAVTTQEYDGLGRLRRVIDPGGTKTRYAYDVKNRLTNVCMDEQTDQTCRQTRSFAYDNRGFLVSEVTPEVGVSGNGTTSYKYDSRGNVIRKTIGQSGGPFDVELEYDRAGRLVRVHEARLTNGIQRDLKRFEYGADNQPGDYRSGKIKRAIRNNWLDINMNVQVAEVYTYGGLDGKPSSRTTTDWECTVTGTTPCNTNSGGAVTRQFTQGFTHDPLGPIKSLDYPECVQPAACAQPSPAIPSRTVTNNFSNGWLTSVTWAPAPRPAAIEYWDNGMVKKVTHPNLVEDTIALDAARLPRPYVMSTTGAVLPGNCVAPSFSLQPQSTTIPSGDEATLTARAAGETGLAVSYAWYRGEAGDRSAPLGAGVATPDGGSHYETSALSATATFWVEASNSCPNGVTASAAATVTVCSEPAISSQPESAEITRSQSVELDVDSSTAGNLSYQWYTITSTNTLRAISGATSATLRVEPESTTRYRVKVSNTCGTTTSTTATVTVHAPPTAPASIAASWNGSTSNHVVWTASDSTPGIAKYEIERHDGIRLTRYMPNTRSVNNTVPAGEAYLYRVRGVDVNDVAGPWSPYDAAVAMPFTDEPLQAGTLVKGVHLGELRAAIDALRERASLSAGWTSYAAATGRIHASHVLEMRNRLNEARTALGFPPLTFQSPTLVNGVSVIRAIDVQEIRNGLQ